VVFPSSWEGFGNVPVEASIHHRPVVVGDYPVADELRQLGFRWLKPHDESAITQAATEPSAYAEDAAHNHAVVREFLSVKVVGDQVKSLFEQVGWYP
jgi:glycosyltransferase involved in cell wall biosynthesis